MNYSIIQAETNNYDQIYDCLDHKAKHHILITDQVQSAASWEQRIITPTIGYPFDDIFKIRWNPFEYTDSEYVIWLDGSIRVMGDLDIYINMMQAGNYDFATIRHPYRTNIFDEYIAWINMRHYPIAKAVWWMTFMERTGYNLDSHGLYQVNVCIFKNTPIVKEYAKRVWDMLHLFDTKHAERLDQTIATYVLKHFYSSCINVLPLQDSIYINSNTLCIHGKHPNK